MNKALKAHLVSKGWVAEGASDEEFKAALQKNLGQEDGISLDEMTALLAEKDTDAQTKADEFANNVAKASAKATVDGLAPLFKELGTTITSALAKPEKVEDEKPEQKEAKPEASKDAKPDFSAPRVKAASESYSTTKTAVTWQNKRFGQEIGAPARMSYNRTEKSFDEPSELEYAFIGAYAKHLMQRAGFGRVKMTDHDRQLVKELVHKHRFVGIGGSDKMDPERPRKFSEFEIKTVLDESDASTGENAVPEFFDDAVITTPLVHSQLFPHVDLRNAVRGSQAESYSIGTPTFVSTAEGSAVSPFSTTSFVGDFAVPFFPATCVIEWGIDFEEDAAPSFGRAVVAQIGQEALHWLDNQIANGDGTTEPQGIFVASGTSVSSENGTGGDLTYNDALNLAFGIDLAHRRAFGGTHTGYVMNDSMYKAFKMITTGVTGDTRPIYGMELKDYMLGDYPVWIQNDVSDGNICFANLRGYRLYRRQGLQFLMEEAGRTNRLAHKKTLVARMRWGGKIVNAANYIAEMADADVNPDTVAA